MQVIAHIKGQIERGDLAPGDTIPSDRQLAAEWGISRATAQKVVTALRAEGLVESEYGVGTRVRYQVPTAQAGGARFRRMLTIGRATREGERSEILSSELVDAPADVADALGIEPGAPVIRRRRRFLDDQGVTAVSTSWLPGNLADAVPALLRTDPLPGGTIGAVQEATGRQPGQGTDSATARLVTEEEAAELGLDMPQAVLVTTAKLSDEDGQPLEYGVDLIRPGLTWSTGYDLSMV
jgi:GntR family transcriptional regulator